MGASQERSGLFNSRRRPSAEGIVQTGELEAVTVSEPDGKKLQIIKSSETLFAPHTSVGWGCSRDRCEWFMSSENTDMTKVFKDFFEHVHFYRVYRIDKSMNLGNKGKIRLIRDEKGVAEGRCVRAWSV